MSRQFGAGRFGNGPSVYDLSQSEFDMNTRRKLDGLGPVRPQLTAEEVKVAYEDALLEDDKRNTSLQSADEFLLLHPEILDTNKNGKVINTMLKTMFGDVPHTLPQFEAATQALLVTDALDIDKAEVAKQKQKIADAKRKTLIKDRTDTAARAFNADANYENVSLEDLRARANEQLQLAGERGGSDW